MKTGIELIAEERDRQLEEEGYTTEHDDTHISEELAEAAAFYALPDKYGHMLVFWPWAESSAKAMANKEYKTRVEVLAKAGALIAAEIDRLQRLENK